MCEAHARTALLLGDALPTLRDVRVAIVGVGGVGGYAAECLLRLGCPLRLIDYDRYTPSNLNRQLGALVSTMGLLKVDVLYRRFLDIHPEVSVEPISEKLTAQNIDILLDDADYILDMCDDLRAKAVIIEYAITKKKRLLSAMGAGNRLYIGSLCVSTLDRTKNCPLAKRLRHTVPVECQRRVNVLYYDRPIDRRETPVGTVSFAPAYMGVRAAEVVLHWIVEERDGKNREGRGDAGP